MINKHTKLNCNSFDSKQPNRTLCTVVPAKSYSVRLILSFQIKNIPQNLTNKLKHN